MKDVQFDSTLNLVRAVLGLCALVATARVALQKGAGERVPRWLPVVGLIVIALFPHISASGDILRLGHGLDAPVTTTRTTTLAERERAQHLLRLYDTLGTPLACRLVDIAFEVLLVAFSPFAACRLSSRVAPEVGGRSPPYGWQLTRSHF